MDPLFFLMVSITQGWICNSNYFSGTRAQKLFFSMHGDLDIFESPSVSIYQILYNKIKKRWGGGGSICRIDLKIVKLL